MQTKGYMQDCLPPGKRRLGKSRLRRLLRHGMAYVSQRILKQETSDRVSFASRFFAGGLHLHVLVTVIHAAGSDFGVLESRFATDRSL